MQIMHNVIDSVLGRTHRVKQLQQLGREMTASQQSLRESVSKMGEEVYTRFIETGDPLRALVHSARSAQFHRQIEREGEAEDDGK